MKVCVHGLWHLGSVTAACLAAEGIDVVGLDDDRATVEGLARGVPPLHEPGLAELVQAGAAAGRLRFTTDVSAVRDADVVWIAFDVPVDAQDRADSAFVTSRVESLFPHLADGAVVLVSSQLPVGTTRALARRFEAVAHGRHVSFACTPENLRLGRAIEAFRSQARIVLGVDEEHARALLGDLLGRFSGTLQLVSVESAEMAKHALNAWLALSVGFANELASLCERAGADAREVEEALRSEPRVGRGAYLRPGAAFAGGTLARDVATLVDLGARESLPLPLLASVLPSNEAHRAWALRRARERLGALAGRRVVVLGLAYKPGTDALRRSIGVELCEALLAEGAEVRAWDPVVRAVPSLAARGLAIERDLAAALEGAEAALVATEWPELRELEPGVVLERMRRALLVDAGAHLARLQAAAGVEHVVLGRPS